MRGSDTIVTEFNKGILIVRIDNDKNYDNYYDELKKIITDTGVKNLVICINKIENNNLNKLKFICNNYNLINRHNGKLIICSETEDNIYHKLNELEIFIVNDELTALRLLEI